MENAKVSIIIPVYNGSDYVEDAIESALAQTYSNCEIIVVNDGSDDDGETERKCKGYNDKIRYFRKKNGGVASAINYGINVMEGDYFAWLSHDDLFLPNKIETQMRELEKHDDKNAVVFGNFTFLNTFDETKHIFNVEDYCESEKIEKGIYPILFGLVHFCTVMVSKKRIQEVGGCNENLKTTQDVEWLFRLLRYKENIYIKEPLTIVRLHEKQGKRTIHEYSKEQTDIHLCFQKRITKEEIEELFGNELIFYLKMSDFYRADGNVGAYEYARSKYNELYDSIVDKESDNRMREHYLELENENGLVILGAGNIGNQFCTLLLSRGIKVKCFADNDSKKWGNFFCGKECVALKDIDIDSFIVVAVNNPSELIEEVREKGFNNVVSYREIQEIVENILPIKL